MVRIKHDRWTKRLLEWRSTSDKRNRGRPPSPCTEDLKRITSNWSAEAQNRKKLEESMSRSGQKEGMNDDDDDEPQIRYI